MRGAHVAGVDASDLSNYDTNFGNSHASVQVEDWSAFGRFRLVPDRLD
jgi:hypothetical protein